VAECNTGPYTVFFDFDESTITPEAAQTLNAASTSYRDCGTARVMLAGHTDRAGSQTYNIGLAERRNDAVRSYLVGRGVPSARINSEAFGEARPRVPTQDGVREPQNRRVEITYGPNSGM
jgi:outer membrane protein OmpA-like peptidoglycan-associated protein